MLHSSPFSLVDSVIYSNEGDFLVFNLVFLLSTHYRYLISVTLTLLTFTGDLLHGNFSLHSPDHSSCPGGDIRGVPKGTGVLLDSKV